MEDEKVIDSFLVYNEQLFVPTLSIPSIDDDRFGIDENEIVEKEDEIETIQDDTTDETMNIDE